MTTYYTIVDHRHSPNSLCGYILFESAEEAERKAELIRTSVNCKVSAIEVVAMEVVENE